jgi:hypothetical protein
MPCLGALPATTLAGAAAGEVYFSDPSVEISGTGARGSQTCTLVMKPTQTFGGPLAPRLVIVTEGESRLSFGVENPAQYRSVVIVQENTRRPFVAVNNAGIGQFRFSYLAKALQSQRLFFVTAQRADRGGFVSSRYERVNFDAILAKVGSSCPFDAESLMADVSHREREEQGLGISESDLTLIRWALNKRYGGSASKPDPRLSLSEMERTYLKRYAGENGLTLSRYLRAETARRLISEGQTLSKDEPAILNGRKVARNEAGWSVTFDEKLLYISPKVDEAYTAARSAQQTVWHSTVHGEKVAFFVQVSRNEKCQTALGYAQARVVPRRVSSARQPFTTGTTDAVLFEGTGLLIGGKVQDARVASVDFIAVGRPDRNTVVHIGARFPPEERARYRSELMKMLQSWSYPSVPPFEHHCG